MSNSFYRLPQSILIKIYKYNGSYKDILEKEIGKELWQNRWFLWNCYAIQWNVDKRFYFNLIINYLFLTLFLNYFQFLV